MANEPAQLILLYFIVPLWLLAGLADWACHKQADIAATSGLKESAIHLLMFVEVGVPLLMAIFLEINALIIVIAFSCFLLHEATALWDVSYARKTREVSAIEQHVHSFLEMIPLMALVLIVAAHWQAFLSVFGQAQVSPTFAFIMKSPALSGQYITLLLIAVMVVVIGPFIEEFIRCYKAQRTEKQTLKSASPSR